MGLRERTRRLETRAGLDKDGPCPECGGRIVYAERRPDGTVTYPLEGPCSACGNRPADGTVGIIEVVLPADGPREESQGRVSRTCP